MARCAFIQLTGSKEFVSPAWFGAFAVQTLFMGARVMIVWKCINSIWRYIDLLCQL